MNDLCTMIIDTDIVMLMYRCEYTTGIIGRRGVVERLIQHERAHPYLFNGICPEYLSISTYYVYIRPTYKPFCTK